MTSSALLLHPGPASRVPASPDDAALFHAAHGSRRGAAEASLVLVPFRAGAPSGSLRFELSGADPSLVARACLGALGRFGRVQRALALVHPGEAGPESCEELVAALEERARRLPGLALRVAVLPSSGRDDGLEAGDRDDPRAVAAAVDRLLDRHPRAELPDVLLHGVDDLVRRALTGPDPEVRPAGLAALVVAVQRSRGADRVLRSARSGDPGAAGALAPLLRRAAVVAPASERAGVLVLLARILAGEGRADEAGRLADEAVALDPHHAGARRVAAALAADRRERAA
ncbi:MULTISPECIES: hypothetical protein [unclassified Rathayibacter]|uniref:hypothetical protein n=1 Tax=unclassified Rathayibacter TaxID=2609250 RepID=UPI000CE7FC46|nr:MULTISPECIES: hypothetical protein [unclassified Rathayibacter]PPG11107.1 hypothetical protein C5C26_01320 [Rathayibacter sp. AY2B1]PPG72362.1 hypothetical protein C5C59_07100 [Rathayibacter sp. AY1F4]